jgi:hypothetical protein
MSEVLPPDPESKPPFSRKAVAGFVICLASPGLWPIVGPWAVLVGLGLGWLLALLARVEMGHGEARLRGRSLAEVTLVIGPVGAVGLLSVVTVVLLISELAARGTSRNNLEQLARAMYVYEDRHRRLPPPAIRGENGEPLLSWRVELLPFIGEEDLYNQFRRDEPWDSPHNIRLLERMPRIYASPNGKKTPQPYSTFYQVFVGKGTPFEGPKGVSLGAFIVRSRTILIIEAGEAVPWTKPEDLPYDPDRPLPPLGGVLELYVQAAMADGSVEVFEKAYPKEADLRAMITLNGGEHLPRSVSDTQKMPIRPGDTQRSSEKMRRD